MMQKEPPYDELIEVLRRDWQIEASWDGLRRVWYVGWTDEHVESCAECAKGLGAYADSLCDPLKAENAKLRELVRDLYECVSHANEQDWFYFERNMLGCGMCCTVNGEGCGLSVLADRMRELGVDA